MIAPDPTAGERGIEFPAHHIVGVDLGFTCTNCGGHTSLTPPCIPARTYPLTPASPPAVAAPTGTSEDVEVLGLLALLTAHRPNVVTEPYRDPETGDQFRTRVKCDGETCNFYREGPRYWSVMDEHTAHLASLLAAREAAARAEERERIAQAIEADADHRSSVGFVIAGAAMTRAARIAREGRP